MTTKRTLAKKAPAETSAAEPRAAEIAAEAERGARIVEAARGDSKLAVALLNSQPHLAEKFGALAGRAIMAWVYRATDGDELRAEAMHRSLAQMRKELLGPSPSKVEQMLATRIEICWLQVHAFDVNEARGGRSLQQAALDLKRQDRAHRRYLSALKALVEVRRLMTPSVQVNIAEQQVNVASLTGPSPAIANDRSTVEAAPSFGNLSPRPDDPP